MNDQQPIGTAADPARAANGPNRLGFAVKVTGKPGLKSNDSRRWQNEPHLRVSLGYLDAIFDWLAEQRIRMYRISSDIAPYVTHPDLPQFHRQLDEAADEVAAIGARARALDLRLSMHPSQYIVLNSPDERVATSATADFAFHADFLDALGTSSEAKIITHVGGVYGNRAAAIDRWVARYEMLAPSIRRRLVLENDEISYSVADILSIHLRCGVPLVFDILHHQVNGSDELSDIEACRACLATWPAAETPKIHYSSQRRADREVSRRDRATGARQTVRRPAKAGQHDDWIDAGEFVTFVRAMGDARFDIMLEAKQKDRALLALRDAIAGAGLSERIW